MSRIGSISRAQDGRDSCRQNNSGQEGASGILEGTKGIMRGIAKMTGITTFDVTYVITIKPLYNVQTQFSNIIFTEKSDI